MTGLAPRGVPVAAMTMDMTGAAQPVAVPLVVLSE
jgi:hypothetical protein